MINSLKVRKMLSKGCTSFLVELGLNNKETLVVQEFSNVFPKELPGLALE